MPAHNAAISETSIGFAGKPGAMVRNISFVAFLMLPADCEPVRHYAAALALREAA